MATMQKMLAISILNQNHLQLQHFISYVKKYFCNSRLFIVKMLQARFSKNVHEFISIQLLIYGKSLRYEDYYNTFRFYLNQVRVKGGSNYE